MNNKHKCWFCTCKIKAMPIHDRMMHIELMEHGLRYQKSRRLAEENRALILKKRVKKSEWVRKLVRPLNKEEKAAAKKRIEKALEKERAEEARIVILGRSYPS